MSRNRRIARFGLLPLAAGAALVAATSTPASAGLLPKPGALLGPEVYHPRTPCLHALPLCLPGRSDFAPLPQHAS